MTYTLQPGGVSRDVDGAFIPADEGNADYAAFLAWRDAGHIAKPDPQGASRAWGSVQASAVAALAETDEVFVRCGQTGTPYPTEWAAYAAELLVITKTELGDANTALPVRPERPAGI